MPYIPYLYMVKTIRIARDELHKELLKIQGEMQSKSGVYTSMDDVIEHLLKIYRKK